MSVGTDIAINYVVKKGGEFFFFWGGGNYGKAQGPASDPLTNKQLFIFAKATSSTSWLIPCLWPGSWSLPYLIPVLYPLLHHITEHKSL